MKSLFKKKGGAAAAPKAGKGGSNKRAVLMLLLLLLAGGGYLFTQEGGLDLQPILELAGLGEPATTAAPPPAPAPRRPKTAAGAPAAAGASASGQINGQPFRVDGAEFRDGVLTLRQGRAFAPEREVAVYLFTEKWQVPEGRSFTVKAGDGGSDNPHVQLGWKQEGEDQLKRRFSTSGFELELRLNKVAGDRLSGDIKLDMGSNSGSHVNGKFNADLTGFYVLNGKPNLKSDSHETLAYLALTHVLKDDPGKKISDVRYRNARYSTSGASQNGSLDLEYRNGKKKRILKQHFEFSKNAAGWQVSQAGDAR